MQWQLANLLQKAGLKLRKWCANHAKLWFGTPPEYVELNLDFDNQSTKILGLTWNIKENIQQINMITKRSIT